MKHSPGRKQRRNNLYDRLIGKNGKKDNHGQPNTVHAMGVMNPQEQTKTYVLTNKRREMLNKYPDRILPSERDLLKDK